MHPQDYPRIVGMMRVKNEERWIERSIRSLLPICSAIYVFDDHSTDLTMSIAAQFPQVILYDSPFDTFGEIRDKNWLLDRIAETDEPDFVIQLDGDEELEPGAEEKIRSLIRSPKFHAAFFKILYLWDREDQVRMDGLYSRFHRQSMWRYSEQPGCRTFTGMYGPDSKMHCTNVPWAFVDCAVRTDINVLHWGYYDREIRLRKYEFYNAQDPGNKAEDHYRHMVIGDIFPPESQFLHAGPLRLEPLRL